MYEWKAFTEEELKIISANPYVKSVTQKMIRFTKEFKEECWRRFSEEHQTVRKIMTEMGFDPEILGQKRMDGIIIHLREQSEMERDFVMFESVLRAARRQIARCRRPERFKECSISSNIWSRRWSL